MASTNANNSSSHKKANPYAWALKKIRLQKKLTTNCAINKFKPLLRSDEDGANHILAALMRISPYKITQTMGNTIAGGDNGGCDAVWEKIAVPSLLSQPESAPTASDTAIQNR